MGSVEADLKEELLKEYLEIFLPSVLDDPTFNTKDLYLHLAERYDCDVKDIKVHKAFLKQIVPQILEDISKSKSSKNDSELQPAELENEDEPNEEESEDSEQPSPEQAKPLKKIADDKVIKKRRVGQKKMISHEKMVSTTRVKQRKVIEKVSDTPGLDALKELGRACGIMGPLVHKLLKEKITTEEKEEFLREKIASWGVQLKKGRYPTKNDIASARRKRERQQDLEGIDTALIIHGSSRTRRKEVASKPKHQAPDELTPFISDNDSAALSNGEVSAAASKGISSSSEAEF